MFCQELFILACLHEFLFLFLTELLKKPTLKWVLNETKDDPKACNFDWNQQNVSNETRFVTSKRKHSSIFEKSYSF